MDDNPCLKVKWRKVDNKERNLVTSEELDRLCEAALKASKNAIIPPRESPQRLIFRGCATGLG